MPFVAREGGYSAKGRKGGRHSHVIQPARLNFQVLKLGLAMRSVRVAELDCNFSLRA